MQFRKKLDNEEINKIFNHLSSLKQQAESAQNSMNVFKSNASRAVTDLAFTHFRELNDMDADDIRKFGSIISQYSRSLAEDLNKLNFKVKKSQT